VEKRNWGNLNMETQSDKKNINQMDTVLARALGLSESQ
jgi:hypothetical protein